ncbi:DUF317 domain-containing protein [Streptomycetaceae bacterium NBC_01309]
MDRISAETPPEVGSDTRVTVPVRLAGAGEADTVLGALEGWHVLDDTAGHRLLEHPDGGLFVGFLPERPGGYQPDAVWEVTAYASPVDGHHLWKAVFGAETPPEAIAAFIAAASGPGAVRHPEELPDRSRR